MKMEEPYTSLLNLQILSDRSTSLPAYNVIYHAVQSANTSALANTSSANASGDASESYGRDEALAQIEIAVLATIFALAVVGNVCVLVALGRRRKITSRMHMFILHLSIADLLVAFCNILPQLAWDITATFRGGDFLCRLVTFLQVFVMYLSTYVLVMTAVDRYRAICYPLSSYSWTPRTVNVMIAVVYVLSAVLSIPQPLLFKYQMVNDDGDYDCRANFDPPWLLDAYILSFTFLVYVVPFVILAFAYGSICYTIWANQPVGRQPEEDVAPTAANGEVSGMMPEKNGGLDYEPSTPALSTCNSPAVAKRWTISGGQPSNGSLVSRNGVVRPRAHSMRGFSRAKLKTVKLTFVVIVAYLFCWSPFFISHIWWLYDPAQEANSAVVIMVLLSSLNSCCNPWIYLAFSGNLLRHLFPCMWRCCLNPTASDNPAFMLNTPSNSPQRAMEMLVYRGRKKGGAISELRLGNGGLAVRSRGVYGSDGGSPRQQGSPLRPESMSSLLTMRVSRNTASGVRRPSQRSALSPVPPAHSPINGDALLLVEKNVLTSHGSAVDRHGCSAANGLIARKKKIPPDLIIQNHDDDVSAIAKESSSGSNPRSPHLFKRTRLHERPAEEVAEAQMKWEHNMGIKSSAS